MGILGPVQDSRDDLQAARRIQIFDYAKRNGITEIEEWMPGDAMQAILRRKGINSIGVPRKPLGTSPDAPAPGQKVDVVDATDDLLRQAKAQRERDLAEQKRAEKPRNEINALRLECKRLGIKTARTDRIADLKAKLNGENPH